MPTVTEVGQPRVESLLEIWKPVRVQQRQATAHVFHLLPPRPLFADSLLDLDKQEINRRKCAAVLSFMFQCLLIGTLLIVPLMFTEELPRQQLLTFLVAPPPPPPPLPAAEAMAKVVRQIQSDLMTSGQLRTPSRIPQTVQIIHEEEIPPASPSMGGVVGGVVGGVPGGQLGGVIGGIVSQTSTLAAVPKLAVLQPKRIRISQGVTKGLLIQKIEPKYPPLALAARIWGQVVLKAIITKEGETKELQLVSGHPMLVPAAIEAVSQWHYRPYLLNGEPTEVETTVTVTFQLN